MPTPEEMQQKQQQLLERARKGLLKFLDENKGQRNLGEMHEFSMNKYFIQHQGFSKLMEAMVADGLLMYDFDQDLATITDKGQHLARQSVG